MGFPGGSDGKESAYNAGDSSSIPGSGKSPGEGHGNPLQYSCLENLNGVCLACSCLFTQLLHMVQSPGVQRWTRWSLLFQDINAFSGTVFGEVCFFFFLIFIYLLTALGLYCSIQALRCCAWTLSSCCERGLLSSCGLWVSHWAGFSCCRTWALELGLSSCCYIVGL